MRACFATCSENARRLTSTKISMGISDIFASAPFLPLNALVGPDLRTFFFFLVVVVERMSSARQTTSVMREYAQEAHEKTFVRTRVTRVWECQPRSGALSSNNRGRQRDSTACVASYLELRFRVLRARRAAPVPSMRSSALRSISISQSDRTSFPLEELTARQTSANSDRVPKNPKTILVTPSNKYTTVMPRARVAGEGRITACALAHSETRRPESAAV